MFGAYHASAKCQNIPKKQVGERRLLPENRVTRGISCSRFAMESRGKAIVRDLLRIGTIRVMPYGDSGCTNFFSRCEMI